tara:strand:+ start:451 stop:573 length:123 start_codon:yes stop_codon:yes gene_type:complete
MIDGLQRGINGLTMLEEGDKWNKEKKRRKQSKISRDNLFV